MVYCLGGDGDGPAKNRRADRADAEGAGTYPGLTQRELAEQLHISDRAVSKWERGAGFPDVSMLIPLAEALGLSVLELLRGEQSAPCDSEGAARLALDSIQQVQGWKRQERWRQSVCAALGVGALVLWLAVCEPDLSRLGLSGRTAAGTDFSPLVRNASVSPALTLGVSRADPDSSGADYPGPGP